MMKNSELGAVTYLTQSKYGRNENEIMINSYCKDFNDYSKITGIGGNLNENKYNTEQGMNASTTGNLYGIYDMSGGNWEWTEVLYSRYTSKNADIIYNNTANGLYTKSDKNSQLPSNSSKYVTIYPINMEIEGNDGSINKHYSLWSEIYSDAIYEVSSKCGYNTAWFGDRADEDSDSQEGPFSIRGGKFNYGTEAGIFVFADTSSTTWYDVRL